MNSKPLSKILKQILTYTLWVLVALFFGFTYTRILLGPYEESKEGFWYLWYLFYNYGLFYLGLTIGIIIGVLFIILDIFYLKKKLEFNRKSLGIKLLIMLFITVIVAIVHYILEKVVDVI